MDDKLRKRLNILGARIRTEIGDLASSWAVGYDGLAEDVAKQILHGEEVAALQEGSEKKENDDDGSKGE